VPAEPPGAARATRASRGIRVGGTSVVDIVEVIVDVIVEVIKLSAV